MAAKWFACGLSLVIHPVNPFVPTVHCNYRILNCIMKKDDVIDAGLVAAPILHLIICLKKMPDIFIKLIKMRVMNLINDFIQYLKNIAMNIL